MERMVPPEEWRQWRQLYVSITDNQKLVRLARVWVASLDGFTEEDANARQGDDDDFTSKMKAVTTEVGVEVKEYRLRQARLEACPFGGNTEQDVPYRPTGQRAMEHSHPRDLPHERRAIQYAGGVCDFKIFLKYAETEA